MVETLVIISFIHLFYKNIFMQYQFKKLFIQAMFMDFARPVKPIYNSEKDSCYFNIINTFYNYTLSKYPKIAS